MAPSLSRGGHKEFGEGGRPRIAPYHTVRVVVHHSKFRRLMSAKGLGSPRRSLAAVETSPPKTFSATGDGCYRGPGRRASPGRKPIRRGRRASSSAFRAGTSSDITARLIGQWLSEGSASNSSSRIGRRRHQYRRRGGRACVARRLHAALGHADERDQRHALQTLNFNFIRDIAPVASVLRVPAVMMVNPAVPAKTSSGVHCLCQGQSGQDQHVVARHRQHQPCAGELFKMMAGVKLVHVPYSGSQFPDLLGGQVQVTFNPLPSSLDFIKVRQAARAGGDLGTRADGVAGRSARGRIRAGL